MEKIEKILILSPHNPFNRSNGGENRIYLIIKDLAKKNKIILVCPRGKKEDLKDIAEKIIKILDMKKINKKFRYTILNKFDWKIISKKYAEVLG